LDFFLPVGLLYWITSCSFLTVSSVHMFPVTKTASYRIKRTFWCDIYYHSHFLSI
jgi:hypothetical protein